VLRVDTRCNVATIYSMTELDAGGGRPHRRGVLRVRFSADEKATFQAYCTKHKLTISSALRDMALKAIADGPSALDLCLPDWAVSEEASRSAVIAVCLSVEQRAELLAYAETVRRTSGGICRALAMKACGRTKRKGQPCK
jgi:hypothetical protein